MNKGHKSAVLALMLGMAALLSGPAAAQESVCARVKIEIKQELTLERQAFDAEMRITNSLPTTALTEVDIDVKVTDELGAPVEITTDPNNLNAKFFIRVSSKQGIDSIDGAGQVAGNSTATINWLLIPGRDSAGDSPFGKRYLVGATLRYRFGSELQQMELNPDAITVKPLPKLTLDYFLTRDVIADDPFTETIEAPEPYTLGVRVKNGGMAAAKSLKIESAQPTIKDNPQGLLIDFRILGSYVQDLPAGNSLLVNFGDIPASSSKMGRWQMESSLAGKFIDFTATFTHSDELGGALTSILQATNAHLLLRDVRVDLPGRDMVRDFLAIDGSALNVYESAGPDNPVTDRSAEATLAAANGGYRLTLPPSQGFMYVRKPDPYQGQKLLGPVMRADAKAMAVENVWLSKTKNSETKQWEYWLNVFDVNSPGAYDMAFRDLSTEPKPPVLQYISDKVTKEKQQLGFLVEASSPMGKHVSLSADALPSGATFVEQGEGVGYFDWVPAVGQAGEYVVNFIATDGSLSATRPVRIRVESAEPPPGPAVPRLVAPLLGAEVPSLRPQLQVLTGEASNDPTQSVLFELYADEGMTQPVGDPVTVPKNAEAGEPTSWQPVSDLNDNHHYYWRARAVSADNIYSAWVDGSFFTNLYNDPPDSFNLTSPAADTAIDTLTPTLTLTNAQDRDGDAITYGFEVFTDAALTQLYDSVSDIVPGPDGTTSWTVGVPLANHTKYYWRGVAVDEHGARSDTPSRWFTVDTGNAAPTAPVPLSPINGVDVTSAGTATLTVQNSSDADNDPLTYLFEIDTLNTFDSSNRQASDPLVAGNGTTSWSVDLLVENQRYYWRVKANDGRADSVWAIGEFVMDAQNEAPSAPVIDNPGDRAWVATLYPTLKARPSTDPEGDPLRYRFEVYSDAALQNRVASGLSDTGLWLVNSPLVDKATHYWRVRAEDNVGAVSGWSTVSTLFVSTGTYVAPSIALSSPSAIVDVRDGLPAIAWEGTDANIEPTIALYYDQTGSGFSGNRIVDGLRQDAGTHSGSYVWNTAALTPGAYWVYGLIYDDRGLGRAYAPGTVVVPFSPQLGGVQAVAGTSLSLREGRDSGSISISLTRAPQSEVVVPLTSSDPTEANVQPTQLVFNSSNWATPQTATVIAVADGVRDGDQPFTVSVGKVVSRDPHYIGLSATPLTGSVIDQNGSSTEGLTIASYVLASKQLDSKTGRWEYRYRAVLTNNGTRAKGVTAEIADAPGFVVVQGRLRFGTVDQNESVISDKEIILSSATDIGTGQPVIYWQLRAL